MKGFAPIAATIGSRALVSLFACARPGEAETADAREVTVTMGEFTFATWDSVFQASVPYRVVL